MNLRVYNAKDKLRETIDAMAYMQTLKGVDKLFSEAIQELIEYQKELKKEIMK